MHQLWTTVVYVRYLQEPSAAAASSSVHGAAWGSSGSKKVKVMFYKIYFQEDTLKSLRQLMLFVKFRRKTLQLAVLRPTHCSSAWAELNSVVPCCRSEVSTAGKIVHNNASNGTQTYSPAQKWEWWGLDRFFSMFSDKSSWISSEQISDGLWFVWPVCISSRNKNPFLVRQKPDDWSVNWKQIFFLGSLVLVVKH